MASSTSGRKRLTQEESRSAALEAARSLLIESGPQAVTLKAVAGRIGRTHANLLHHFGSALGLQQALAAHICENIATLIEATLDEFESGASNEATARMIVDLTFDAFDSQGAGHLATWMTMVGHDIALEPIVETIHALVERLQSRADTPDDVAEVTHNLVLLALGHSIMGGELARSLAIDAGVAKKQARTMVLQTLSKQSNRSAG